MILQCSNFYDEHSDNLSLVNNFKERFNQDFKKLKELESNTDYFDMSPIILLVQNYKYEFFGLSDTSHLYFIDYYDFKGKMFIQFDETYRKYFKLLKGKLNHQQIINQQLQFLQYNSLNIHWCIENRIFLNCKGSFGVLRNLFLTEGLILLHRGLFSPHRFAISCLELMVLKCREERFEKSVHPFLTYYQIYELIKELFNSIESRKEDLLNFKYQIVKGYVYTGAEDLVSEIQNLFPSVSKLPVRKIWNPDMYNKDFVMEELDMQKSYSDNCRYFIDKYKITEKDFNHVCTKFDIHFTERKTRVQNDNELIQTIKNNFTDEIFSMSNYFILDKLAMNNLIDKDLFCKMETKLWKDENDNPRFDFYKIAETKETKKLIRVLDNYRFKNKIKINKGQTKKLNNILK